MASKKRMNICHITSAHARDDIRIFVKQCVSLNKQEDFNIMLVVADGKGNDIVEGIQIFDTGRLEGRLNRFTKTAKKVFLKAKDLDCDIYQFHDPELIPYVNKFKKLNKKVIFDAHEDLPQQLRSKPYLNKFLKILLPIIFEQYEKIMFKKFDALIGATPYITNKLKSFNLRAVNINNYPIIGELDEDVDWDDKENEISYIGAISDIRGINQIVDAMQYVKTNVKLNLVGEFNTKTLLSDAKKSPGWKNVKYYGLVNRKEVSKILSKSKAGIVTFLPVPNHVNSQPNKMFEYMSVGIPIITSNFPLWKEVVEDNNCGITVEPTEPKSIAKAIDKLIENNNLAKKLGQNGKGATLNKFSWNAEENKLFRLYKDLK